MTVRTKVCGIRSVDDLTVAVEAGVDAVGFICGVTHRSEDALTPERAAELASLTPPYVSRVLVTHLVDAGAILDLARRIGADTIQVHGLVDASTTAAVVEGARGRVVTRAVHVTGPDALAAAAEVVEVCSGLHLDSRTADRLGGTGKTHDWSISAEIAAMARARGVPVVLAGGLRPDNVAEAIRVVRPYAIDVNSGVEDEAGDKSPVLLGAFVEAARAAAARLTSPA